MIYQVMTESMFKDAFKALRPENFSNAGLSELFHFFEEIGSDDCELDVIAVCCDFSQEPLDKVLENYNLKDMEELEENTLVVAYGFDYGEDWVLYQVF